MTTFDFETISASAALSLSAFDSINVGSDSAARTTVLYLADGTFSVMIGARTVTFGAAFGEIARAGQVTFADGSQLYVGDATANTRDFGRTTPSQGAIYGGDGDDQLTSGAGAWLVQGNQGADRINADDRYSNTIYGGQGNDTIAFNTPDGTPRLAQFAQGNKGEDLISGGNGPDTLLGGQGNDTIAGYGGADILNGNLGNDFVEGTGLLNGEDGNDTLIAAGSSTSVFGGDGDDRIFTSDAAYVDAGVGRDTIENAGRGGNSTVLGGEGDDTIDGHLVSSEFRMDYRGGEGNDSLNGSRGADTISGGGGNDTINGDGGPAGGHDLMAGGSGQDAFLITNRSFDARGGTIPLDTPSIVDWEGGDKLDFQFSGSVAGSSANYHEISASSYDAALAAAVAFHSNSSPSYVAAQVGADVIVFGGGLAVILTGRSLGDIDFTAII